MIPPEPYGVKFSVREFSATALPLVVDARAFEAQESKNDRSGRNDPPLGGVHLIEATGKFSPDVKKPPAEREAGKNGIHDEPRTVVVV